MEQPKSASGVRLDLREDAEARLAEWQLVELGIQAPEVLLTALVAALDLDPAHRQRAPAGSHGAELSVLLGLEHEREVDLYIEHLLHTADIGPAELDERVEEGAFAFDASGRVDDLVAVNFAAPALDLVLWVERELLRNDL
jgi:hypothetical protein